MYYWASDILLLLMWSAFSFYIPTLVYLGWCKQEDNRLTVESLREERRRLESAPVRRPLLDSGSKEARHG